MQSRIHETLKKCIVSKKIGLITERKVKKKCDGVRPAIRYKRG